MVLNDPRRGNRPRRTLAWSRRLAVILLLVALVPWPPVVHADLPVVRITIDAPDEAMIDGGLVDVRGHYGFWPAGVPLAKLYASVDGMARGWFLTKADGSFSHPMPIGEAGPHTITIRDPQTGESATHDIFVIGRPSAVQNLTGTTENTTAHTSLSWDPPAETWGEPIVRYEMVLNDGTGDAETLLLPPEPTTKSVYAFWNTTTRIKVYARTEAGASTESPTYSTILGPAPPSSPPTNVTLFDGTYSDRAVLHWEAPDRIPARTTIDRYIVYAKRGTEDYLPHATIDQFVDGQTSFDLDVELRWDILNAFYVVAEHEYATSPSSTSVSRDIGAEPNVTNQADRIRACTGFQLSVCTVVAPGSTIWTPIEYGTMLDVFFSGAVQGEGGDYGPLPIVTHAEGGSCTDTGCTSINETTSRDSGNFSDVLYGLAFNVPPHGGCATVTFDLVSAYRTVAMHAAPVSLTVCHEQEEDPEPCSYWCW